MKTLNDNFSEINFPGPKSFFYPQNQFFYGLCEGKIYKLSHVIDGYVHYGN